MAAVPSLIPRAWDDEALDALHRPAANPFGPLNSARGTFHGAQLFEFIEGGQRALLALRPLNFDGGRRIDVVGLASLGDRLQAESLRAALDDLALRDGADMLAMCTIYPHLARACQRMGWAETGRVLTKKLKVH